MSQVSTGKGREDREQTESDGYSTDDYKRKREQESPQELFRRSKKTARTPIKSKMGDENKEIKGMLEKIMNELGEIRRENKEHREETMRLRRENDEMKREIEQLKKRMDQMEVMENKMERMDRTSRKNNLIISGVDTGTADNREVIGIFEKVIKESLQIEAKIEEVNKINGDMWVAKTENFGKKIEILKNKHRLRNSNYKRVFITNDLTELERKVQKIVRERAEKEKNEGRRTKIGYQKITIEGKRWIWNRQKQELEEENENRAAKNDTNRI